MSVSTPALDALVRSLQEEFRGSARAGRVTELLGQYVQANSDWREFALFSEQNYTRNLVAREARFELMVLCWGTDQASLIHNHEGQDCWMAVLEGEMEEARFEWPDPRAAGPLRAKGSLRFTSGQVAFIRDEMGLHLVRPWPPGRASGITLHLYSLPYDDCNCYCPETGQVTRRRLGHYSVRGRILPAVTST
jgi:cysteine dioxygenase